MRIHLLCQLVGLGALLTMLCGCRTLATLAHECGTALDPCVVPSIPENSCGPGPPLPPHHLLDGGVSLTSHEGQVPDIEFVRTQVDELTAKTQELQGSFDDMQIELSRRTDDLVQTREDFSHLRGELSNLRATADAWQQQLVDFRSQLKRRDEQRLNDIQRLTTMVSRLANTADVDQPKRVSRQRDPTSQ